MEKKLIHKHTTHTCNSPPNALAIHKDSKAISKAKPKVRIIHIFAPKIIKTDVENFRELVQMKTGKPSSGGEKRCNKINSQDSIRIRSNNNSHGLVISGTSHHDDDGDKHKSSMKEKMLDQCSSREISSVVVKEELSTDEISCGGYLGGFSDLEGFISDQLGGFQLLPLDTNHLQGFE